MIHGFIVQIKSIYRIEFQIARDKDKLSKHYKKWGKLVEILAEYSKE